MPPPKGDPSRGAASALPAPWAYEAWDELVGLLDHSSNRTRAIAAQMLCNLALREWPKR